VDTGPRGEGKVRCRRLRAHQSGGLGAATNLPGTSHLAVGGHTARAAAGSSAARSPVHCSRHTHGGTGISIPAATSPTRDNAGTNRVRVSSLAGSGTRAGREFAHQIGIARCLLRQRQVSECVVGSALLLRDVRSPIWREGSG
jgi:hypothetical protein